jgi:hypothetical protein
MTVEKIIESLEKEVNMLESRIAMRAEAFRQAQIEQTRDEAKLIQTRTILEFINATEDEGTPESDKEE